MFNKKNKSDLRFEEELSKVMTDLEVKAHPTLMQLFNKAKSKIDKNNSVQSVASNLAYKLKENFSEAELPKIVVEFQLKIEKYTAFGANGIVW